MDLRFLAVDDGRHREDPPAAVPKNRIARASLQKVPVGTPLRVVLEDLPERRAGAARRAKRNEAEPIRIFRRVLELRPYRVEIVHADRCQLAIAAQRPVQVLLHLHHDLDRLLIQRDILDHRAGDVRTKTPRIPHGRVDPQFRSRGPDRVDGGTRLDPKISPQRASQAAGIEHVRPHGQELHPHDFDLRELLEARGIRAMIGVATITPRGRFFPLRPLLDPAAPRAPRARQAREALHVAADLFEDAQQTLAGQVGAEARAQRVERDSDHRHSGTPFSHSVSGR